MITRNLNQQIIDALKTAGDESLKVVDPETNRAYLIVDEQTHLDALKALRAQSDRNAIAEGIAQMEAGLGKPADQAFEDIRKELGLSEQA